MTSRPEACSQGKFSKKFSQNPYSAPTHRRHIQNIARHHAFRVSHRAKGVYKIVYDLYAFPVIRAQTGRYFLRPSRSSFEIDEAVFFTCTFSEPNLKFTPIPTYRRLL